MRKCCTFRYLALITSTMNGKSVPLKNSVTLLIVAILSVSALLMIRLRGRVERKKKYTAAVGRLSFNCVIVVLSMKVLCTENNLINQRQTKPHFFVPLPNQLGHD